jgi:hypothetical protein
MYFINKKKIKIEIKPRNKNLTNFRKSSLSDESYNVLCVWLENNIGNPYPSREIKETIAKQAKVSILKLEKWLQNKRAKLKKTRRSLLFIALQLKINLITVNILCSIIFLLRPNCTTCSKAIGHQKLCDWHFMIASSTPMAQEDVTGV